MFELIPSHALLMSFTNQLIAIRTALKWLKKAVFTPAMNPIAVFSAIKHIILMVQRTSVCAIRLPPFGMMLGQPLSPRKEAEVQLAMFGCLEDTTALTWRKSSASPAGIATPKLRLQAASSKHSSSCKSPL